MLVLNNFENQDNSDDFYNCMKSVSFRSIIRKIYENENGINLDDLLLRNQINRVF